MGYTLGIGELETKVYYEGVESSIRNRATGIRLEEAPKFNEPTDCYNERWPSYTAWTNFSKFVGLYDLFYDKSFGLIRNHPGCVPLVKEHKEMVDDAYTAFYIKYPNCKPGYSPKINEREGVWEDPDWPEENCYAVRLEWLKFWVDWSLVNCKNPVFSNS